MADKFVFREPAETTFDKIGHTGKVIDTGSSFSNHLIIETDEGISKSLIEHKCEFSYFVISGSGAFIINGESFAVRDQDLVVIPPGNIFTFSGKMKLLLINTPAFTPEQEEELPKQQR